MPERRTAPTFSSPRIGPALVLSAALLAACQAAGPAAPAPGTAAPETETSETEPAAAPAVETAAPAPTEESAEDRETVATLPPAPPPEPAVNDDPGRLMGLGAQEVDALLGPPDLVRREPPAEVRQYSADGCVFDVFLYDEAGGYRVTYLEARDLEARRIAARPCLNRLLRARLAGAGG